LQLFIHLGDGKFTTLFFYVESDFDVPGRLDPM